MQYLGAISKMTEWFKFVSRQTIQHHSNPSLIQSPNLWCQRSWSWMVLWRPTRPSRTNTKKKKKKKCHFHHRGLECKSRKSKDTWSNRQVWPYCTKWSRVKVNRVLSREHTGHNKHPFPTIWETSLHMNIIKWWIPKLDWLYSLQPKMEKLCMVRSNKTQSWMWLRSWALHCFNWRTWGKLLGHSGMT